MTADDKPAPTDLQIKHVLVPLDGSELAIQALPTARVLAERFDADVHTASVASDEKEGDELRALASAVLRVDANDERVFVVTGGDPADGIAARAKELGSCLVCLATHGRGRFTGAVIGSVARSVLQQSSEPMIALGPSADNPGWYPGPRNWPKPLSVPRLLACVDGSEPSEQILPLAMTWAQALGMSATIVTVVEDAPPPLRPELQTSPYGVHADAESYIRSLVEQWRATFADVDGQVIHDPIGPASGIRTHLAQRPAGLVAVTTHARSGMERVRLGATAAGIVQASIAPCLVAPVQP